VEVSALAQAVPHDLILFTTDFYQGVLPEWADRVNGRTWSVVRRERAPGEGLIAAGVRGRQRAQRRAIVVNSRDIIRTVTPEALAEAAFTDPANHRIARALEILSAAASSRFGGRAWGPTGSVGYQLATGTAVVHAASDLDIIIRADQYLSCREAQSILDFLTRLPCRVDCLLETADGAVALAEWARSKGNEVLLRTPVGPQLTRNPWHGDGPPREATSR
jgi:phosphoribosyl-dephospho-CoA transferase